MIVVFTLKQGLKRDFTGGRTLRSGVVVSNSLFCELQQIFLCDQLTCADNLIFTALCGVSQ